MSDLAAALKGAEEALAKFARCRCEILCEQTPSCAVTMESALHSLLSAAREAESALAEERERRERAESILRKARTWSLIWAEGPAMHDGVALRDAVDAHFGEGAYQSVAALRAAPAQPHSSRCACRTGDGPGLHDDGCPVTLPTPLDGDGRDGFNGPGPFEG